MFSGHADQDKRQGWGRRGTGSSRAAAPVLGRYRRRRSSRRLPRRLADEQTRASFRSTMADFPESG